MRLGAIVLAVSGLMSLSQPAVGSVVTDHGPQTTPLSCDGKPMGFHRHRARVILKKAYAITYYSTHDVASKDQVAAFKAHKRCILEPGDRGRLAKMRHDFASFQRTRISVTPYARGDGTYWAIPTYVVGCESGFDYYPPDYGDRLNRGGAYGLLDSWGLRGGYAYARQANEAPTWAQDIVAARAWAAHDSWACA